MSQVDTKVSGPNHWKDSADINEMEGETAVGLTVENNRNSF